MEFAADAATGGDLAGQQDHGATPDAAMDFGAGLSPEEVYEKHRGFQDAVIEHLHEHGELEDGDWQKDYGDAALWGPSFDLAWWSHTADDSYRVRAIAALERNRLLAEEGAANPASVLGDPQNVAMALLGLLESGLYLDAPAYLTAADALLERMDRLSMQLSDYIDIQAPGVEENIYGPTTVSVFVPLMHLEHVLAYPDLDRTAHLDRAAQALENIHAAAWNETLEAYRFRRDDDDLYLYPNIMMMVAYGRLYQLGEDPVYLERAVQLYDTIAPLKDVNGDHYHSPYSADAMGATDPDYSTLSSQNYLMLALWLLYLGTGDSDYLEEIDSVLTFLKTRLLDDGRILHHWMNQAPAQPSDPSYYCSGCNLQTLYILQLLREGP